MGKRWSDDEITILVSHYRDNNTLCLKMLADRSLDAIRRKASDLGIKCNIWSPEEITYLRFYYPTMGSVGCFKFIDRSSLAIKDKQIGCFRLLPYSPIKLRQHLDSIRTAQNNCCPLCRCCYDNVGFHIDHIIPLAMANTIVCLK